MRAGAAIPALRLIAFALSRTELSAMPVGFIRDRPMATESRPPHPFPPCAFVSLRVLVGKVTAPRHVFAIRK